MTDEQKQKQREYYQEWYRKNRAKRLAKQREYYESNREECLTRTREWQDSPKGRELKRAAGRRYINSDKGKLKQRVVQHKRRAQVRDSDGDFTVEEWNKLISDYPYCVKCKNSDCELTMDHIVPLSKGGSNDISNIQPLCMPCNLEKGVDSTCYLPTASHEH